MSKQLIHTGRGQTAQTCGQAADNAAFYTQNPSTMRIANYQATYQQVHNHQVTNISHTVFTQPLSIFLSVTGCLYTLSTYPTKKTINSNNI